MIIKILIPMIMAYIIISLYIGVINASGQSTNCRHIDLVNKVFFPQGVIAKIADKR